MITVDDSRHTGRTVLLLGESWVIPATLGFTRRVYDNNHMWLLGLGGGSEWVSE